MGVSGVNIKYIEHSLDQKRSGINVKYIGYNLIQMGSGINLEYTSDNLVWKLQLGSKIELYKCKNLAWGLQKRVV